MTTGGALGAGRLAACVGGCGRSGPYNPVRGATQTGWGPGITKMVDGRPVTPVNKATAILYTYTPVPGDGTLFGHESSVRFTFPRTLDEWATPAWQQLSMRRGDGLPWITRAVQARARNFERVLNAYYPTVTDVRLRGPARVALRGLAAWRYWLGWYAAPIELRAMQRWLRYQRPETTGF